MTAFRVQTAENPSVIPVACITQDDEYVYELFEGELWAMRIGNVGEKKI